MNSTSQALIRNILKILDEKKGNDIQVMDVRELVSYTDFLILCTGTSNPHIHALVSSIKECFKGNQKPNFLNSSSDDSWSILDFVDVVVHVFKEETRIFYDLEGLWCDSKKMDYKSLITAGSFDGD
jgi:ribosome-associated protein